MKLLYRNIRQDRGKSGEPDRRKNSENQAVGWKDSENQAVEPDRDEDNYEKTHI